MQFNSPTGATTLYPVRVVSCSMDPRHGPMRFRLHVQAAWHGTADRSQSRLLSHKDPSNDDQCGVAQERSACRAGRQQRRLPDRIIRTPAGWHGRVARSGVRGRAPLRVVSDRARSRARRACIFGRRRVPATCSCRIRLLAQRHWPVAANNARDGKRRAGWTIVCGYREQCTRDRRGASRISLADRRFCQENRGFLSTTLAAHFWQRRCS